MGTRSRSPRQPLELCSWLSRARAGLGMGMWARRGPARVARGRMRVVVSATWRAVSVVSRARSCAASVSFQFSFVSVRFSAASVPVVPARSPPPSTAPPGPTAGTSGGTVAGVSAPLCVPVAGTSSEPTRPGSAPLLGSSSSSGTCLFTRVSVGHGLFSGEGDDGVLKPRLAPGGRTGPEYYNPPCACAV